MTKSLALTFIGRDRPGLVSAISDKIAAAGANWQESRLARLAGEFAGIILITVPERNLEALTAGLHELEKAGLRITVEQSSAVNPQADDKVLELNLVGQDRPGIVRDVTQALSRLNVNIEEFTSGIESAAFTGETMFRAALQLRVPGRVASEEVRQALEKLADEIIVDLKTIANEGT